ncbi:MAG: DUF3109 family protein [Candidatus Azobacteroides sp.]|nr:DUF3109 family protein [Candidatus Azobacteroides sp.]
MIQINNTLLVREIIDEFFLCDLSVCKGICCVEGDAGAPVEYDEIARLEAILAEVEHDLSSEAKKVIDQQGAVCLDSDGEYVTSIVKGKDCVFTCYDEKGYCRCAIEKAYREGKIDFQKPISCHLYPIRVVNYNGFQALNYHYWHVCHAAKILGKKEGVKVYQFLKEPLIRKFGNEWYESLCQIAKEIDANSEKSS